MGKTSAIERTAAIDTEALSAAPRADASTDDRVSALTHELGVRQVELEMQNEALRSTQLALEDARDRYLNLFEFAPVGYLALSRNGIINEINLTATRMLGAERVQLLGHRLVEFIAFDDRDRCHVFLRRLCAAPGEMRCNVLLRRADRSDLPVRLSGAAVPSEQGPFALRITLTDISEHRQLEELTESEMRLRLAVEAIPGGLYDWDRRSDSLHWSTTLSAGRDFYAMGVAPSRQLWRERVDADDLRRVRPMMVEAMKHGRHRFSVEYRVRCNDGSWCHVLDRAHVLYDRVGRVARMVGTLTDITAYKETAHRQNRLNEVLEELVAQRTAEAEGRAQALASAERFARETIDSIDTRLGVLDERGNVIATNKAWREFEAGEIGCVRAVTPDDGPSDPYGMACWTRVTRGKARKAVADLLAGRRDAFQLEYQCASKHAPRWFEMHITRFAGAGPTRVVIRHKDITARKQAELDQLRWADRVKQLARHVDSISEARNAAIARELHDELGASLTMLRLGLATLAEQPRGEGARETCTALLGQVDNALQVTRRISGSLRPPTLDALGLITTIRAHVKQFSLTTGIATTLRLAEPKSCLPDATNIAVFRIIQEALTNVAKHSGATRVIISAREWRGTLAVRIVDNGAGIDQDALLRADAFGIIGMRERANHLGGTLKIGGRATGSGTRVSLCVPIADDAERPVTWMRSA